MQPRAIPGPLAPAQQGPIKPPLQPRTLLAQQLRIRRLRQPRMLVLVPVLLLLWRLLLLRLLLRRLLAHLLRHLLRHVASSDPAAWWRWQAR